MIYMKLAIFNTRLWNRKEARGSNIFNFGIIKDSVLKLGRLSSHLEVISLWRNTKEGKRFTGMIKRHIARDSLKHFLPILMWHNDAKYVILTKYLLLAACFSFFFIFALYIRALMKTDKDYLASNLPQFLFKDFFYYKVNLLSLVLFIFSVLLAIINLYYIIVVLLIFFYCFSIITLFSGSLYLFILIVTFMNMLMLSIAALASTGGAHGMFGTSLKVIYSWPLAECYTRNLYPLKFFYLMFRYRFSGFKINLWFVRAWSIFIFLKKDKFWGSFSHSVDNYIFNLHVLAPRSRIQKVRGLIFLLLFLGVPILYFASICNEFTVLENCLTSFIGKCPGYACKLEKVVHPGFLSPKGVKCLITHHQGEGWVPAWRVGSRYTYFAKQKECCEWVEVPLDCNQKQKLEGLFSKFNIKIKGLDTSKIPYTECPKYDTSKDN